MIMLMIRLTVILSISVLLLSCDGEQLAGGDFSAGRTPEWTVQQYQYFIDQNQFEAAKQLSTPAEKTRLDRLAAVMVRESLDDAVLNTDFLKITCREGRKAVYCRCLVEDEYERYEMVYKLVPGEDQWLVDAPNGHGGEEEVIEEVLDGMKEIMQ